MATTAAKDRILVVASMILVPEIAKAEHTRDC